MARVIGIDLGTTTSCVSIVENGKAVIIPNSLGEEKTPSVVAFPKFGECIVGRAAKRLLLSNPERTVSSVKRHIGSPWYVSIDDKKYNAQSISAFLIRQLKKDAENYLGETVTDAVISVPSCFTDAQRQATIDAGRMAGLNVIRIINEPTSAALSYAADSSGTEKILVYDIGGGTFDASVIEIDEGMVSVISTCGDNHLGGDDFDTRIVNWIINEFYRSDNLDLSKDPTAYNRIKKAAENVKKELSTKESTLIRLPLIIQKKNSYINLEMELSRSKFEALTYDLIERMAEISKTVIIDAKLKAAELDRIILVGGTTKIPAVFNKVKAVAGIEPAYSEVSGKCVAMGAAMLGSMLMGENVIFANNSNVLVMDVLSMSISLESFGQVATRIIPRNTTIPIGTKKIFTTASNNAKQIQIHVLQGERPMAVDNKTIGKIIVKGIRRAPAGEPKIEVSFNIDANGILNISAVDLDVHQMLETTLNSNGRMSESDIEKAISNISAIKNDELYSELNELLSEAALLLKKVDLALNAEKNLMMRSERKKLRSEALRLGKLSKLAKQRNISAAYIKELDSAIGTLEQTSCELLKRTGLGDK